MPTFPRVAPLAALVLVLGCEAPAAFEDAPDSEEAPLEAAVAQREEAATASVHGAIVSADGEMLAGARVCILDSTRCTESKENGRFAIGDLEGGVSEALFVIVEGHVPTVVPIDVADGTNLLIDVKMPRGDAFLRSEYGAVRLDTHVVGGPDAIAAEGRWYLSGGDGDMPRGAGRANATIKSVPAGTYEAAFVLRGAGYCALTNGWRGDDRRSASLPVLRGAVTILQQACLVPDREELTPGAVDAAGPR